MSAPIWSSMVGCVSLGRGVLTPHLVFQLASVSDSLYFGLVCEKDMATPYLCLSGRAGLYASRVTGVWLKALCPLPSSTGLSRGLCGVVGS